MVRFDLSKRTILDILYYGVDNVGKKTNLQSIKKFEDSFEIQKFLKDYNIKENHNYFCPKTDWLTKFIAKILTTNSLDNLVLNDLSKPSSIIFVVDSQKERLEENLCAWNHLKKFLNTFDYDVSINYFPLVIQWNKQDSPTAISSQYLEKIFDLQKLDNKFLQTYKSIAIQDVGTETTILSCINLACDWSSDRFRRWNAQSWKARCEIRDKYYPNLKESPWMKKKPKFKIFRKKN